MTEKMIYEVENCSCGFEPNYCVIQRIRKILKEGK